MITLSLNSFILVTNFPIIDLSVSALCFDISMSIADTVFFEIPYYGHPPALRGWLSPNPNKVH
jgi:hypothetical protein